MSTARDEAVRPFSVLVVDDDCEMRKVMRAVLSREGIDVLEASTAGEGGARAVECKPDVVVLDVQLPNASGLELPRELRAGTRDIYVIMLTSDGEDDDLVSAATAGAEDCVAKPFSPRELAARVVAARRRLQADAPSVIEVGDVRIDVDGHQATVARRLLELTRREFALLAFFAANPGWAFSRAELLQEVWSSSAEWPGEATVTEHVRRLPSKQRDPENPELVVAVRGVGYGFESGFRSSRREQ